MHESDPYPYDDAYDPAAVRNQRMERRRREQRRRWRRLLVVCTLVAAVPLLIYGLWRTGRNGPAPVASSGGPSAIAIPEWIDQQIIDLDGAVPENDISEKPRREHRDRDRRPRREHRE